jgi:hypothetical protein
MRDLQRDLQHLHVHVGAHIDGEQAIDHDVDVVIPPAYDAADVRALMVRTIEDAAFELDRREFGRMPTLEALIAAVARLRALEDAVGRFPALPAFAEHRARMRMIFALTNEQVAAQWGEGPDD